MAIMASQSEPSVMQKKRDASDWFRKLRDELCTVFEGIEDSGDSAHGSPGRFERQAWKREGGGGGEMSLMRGRIFEKVGVTVSSCEKNSTVNFFFLEVVSTLIIAIYDIG